MTNLGSRYRKEEKSGGSAWTQTDGQGAWTTTVSQRELLLGLAVVEELGLSLEEEKSRAGCLDWRSLTNLGSR
jgi:hypothetical protein